MKTKLDPAKLKARRAELQMTQQDTCYLAGISMATLARIETHQHSFTQRTTAHAIATALKTTIEALSVGLAQNLGEPGDHVKE